MSRALATVGTAEMLGHGSPRAPGYCALAALGYAAQRVR